MKSEKRSLLSNMFPRHWRPLLVGLSLTVFIPAFIQTNSLADDSQLTIITGVDYAKQDYEWGEETKVLTVPIIVKYETENWITKATLTSLQQVESENQFNAIERYSDLGDFVFGGAYKTSLQFLGENYFDLWVKVKVPSDGEEITDGKMDYMTQIDIFRSHGKWTPFATLGYRWRGDDLYQDGIYGTLGMGYDLNQTWSGGLMVDYNTALYEGETNVVELVPYVDYRFTPEWKLRLYGDTGLTENSVDMGVGFQLIFQPGRASLQ